MPIREIEQILENYRSHERKIDDLINDNLSKQDSICVKIDSAIASGKTQITHDQVIARNKRVLQDLEITKANLRSKAIYSPYEMQWETIIKNYKNLPSLPVTTYRCLMPVFV